LGHALTDAKHVLSRSLASYVVVCVLGRGYVSFLPAFAT